MKRFLCIVILVIASWCWAVVYYIDDITSASYKWTASAGGTNEYHLEASAGGDPGILQPDYVFLNSASTPIGTIGSLADHEWNWGDGDTLGYSTVYFRDDTGDPDVSGVALEARRLREEQGPKEGGPYERGPYDRGPW